MSGTRRVPRAEGRIATGGHAQGAWDNRADAPAKKLMAVAATVVTVFGRLDRLKLFSRRSLLGGAEICGNVLGLRTLHTYTCPALVGGAFSGRPSVTAGGVFRWIDRP